MTAQGHSDIPSEVAKRSSTEKFTMRSTAFDRLPDEIIEQILLLTNPNAFASLIILNRKWRMVSQQAHLYAHHLSRCPSYSAAHHATSLPEDDDALPQLRRLFACEIKRNLFEAYLRPRETIINLVSTSISSSSAPGGEAFHFSLSPRGHYLLAYSSSRIHVLDVTGLELVIKRELKILRRPALTAITDDGSLLAVLSTDLQIDLYDLTGQHAKHTRVISLDHAPRTIALSPTGSVLAAAYDSGVELSSLNPDCAGTDRRAVKCYGVDSLSFSRDGTQLLGTTIQSRNSSTVVLTAPYYIPDGSLPEESVSALWTSSILFPNGSRDCSHAVLLPSPSDDEAGWTFTYDQVFETFRAVRIDDLRNGTTYFTGPTADFASLSKLLPSTLPAASEAGDLVVAGFQGSIWIYGVLEDLDALPINNSINSNVESESGTPSSQLGRQNSAPSLRSGTRPRESTSRTPQWQLLCDRFRNTFIEGRKIATLNGVSAMNWVNDNPRSFHKERLVSVARGIGDHRLESGCDGMSPVDGGRISILDFDYSMNNGTKRVITIEVGNNEPDVLEEEHRDLATEVELVRRRTVAQRRGDRSTMSGSATTAAPPARTESLPLPIANDPSDLLGLRLVAPRRLSQVMATNDQLETASIDEDQEAFDAPYSHTSPRSGTTLRRAATAAAVNRRLHPRAASQDHVEYRRADGREEHPHESDADNWVPPPPPYTRDPVPPLPEHIQRSILAEAAAATLQRANTQRAPSLDFPGLDSNNLQRSRTLASVSGPRREQQYSPNRPRSDSTLLTIGDVSIEENAPPPVSGRVSPDFDELYDVSPPGSPRSTPSSLLTQVPSHAPDPVHQIPRRPVASGGNNNTAPPAPNSAMQETVRLPIEPIPHSATETLDRQLLNWETTTNVDRVSALDAAPPNTTQSPSSTGHTLGETAQEVPLRPNEDHHHRESPTTNVLNGPRDEIESRSTPLSRRSETAPTKLSSKDTIEEPLPIWRRAGTAPNLSTQNYNPIPISTGLVMPSADQLARLNSRKGRPAGHVLADPSRRGSGNFTQRLPPGSEPSKRGSRGFIQNTHLDMTPEQAFNATPPRAAVGAHGSSQNRANSNNSPQHNPYTFRRLSANSASHVRQSLNPSPNLRPPLQRLETIHSMSSTGEPSPWINPKQMTLGRQPSRAERGAAKNIKDAKKRGWRASLKDKQKDKWGDGASSAGWTDVSTQSGSRSFSMFGDREEKRGEKCIVM